MLINTGLIKSAELKQNNDKKPLTSKELKYMRDKDRELVTGVFRFHECPNMPLKFVFRKYKDDPVETYELFDGCEYTIPLGVAKHLNKEGWYPVHEYVLNNGQANPEKNVKAPRERYRIARKVRRFGFQSMDFLDAVEYHKSENELVLAEKA